MKIIQIIAIFAIVLILSGCSSEKPKSSNIGNYQNNNEVSNDNTSTVNTTNSTPPFLVYVESESKPAESTYLATSSNMNISDNLIYNETNVVIGVNSVLGNNIAKINNPNNTIFGFPTRLFVKNLTFNLTYAELSDDKYSDKILALKNSSPNSTNLYLWNKFAKYDSPIGRLVSVQVARYNSSNEAVLATNKTVYVSQSMIQRGIRIYVNNAPWGYNYDMKTGIVTRYDGVVITMDEVSKISTSPKPDFYTWVHNSYMFNVTIDQVGTEAHAFLDFLMDIYPPNINLPARPTKAEYLAAK